MRKILTSVLLIMLSLVIGLGAVAADCPDSTLVHGTVYRESGWRPTGAFVYVYPTNCNTAYARTTANGAYYATVTRNGNTQTRLRATEVWYSADKWYRYWEEANAYATLENAGYVWSPRMSIFNTAGKYTFKVFFYKGAELYPGVSREVSVYNSAGVLLSSGTTSNSSITFSNMYYDVPGFQLKARVVDPTGTHWVYNIGVATPDWNMDKAGASFVYKEDGSFYRAFGIRWS